MTGILEESGGSSCECASSEAQDPSLLQNNLVCALVTGIMDKTLQASGILKHVAHRQCQTIVFLILDRVTREAVRLCKARIANGKTQIQHVR